MNIRDNTSKLILLLSQTQFGGSARLWPFALALIPAFVWVQPHHYPPWSGFHEDVGMVFFVVIIALVMLLMKRIPVEWSAPPIVLGLLAGMVWLQWVIGLIPSIGQTILFSSCLLGCALTWIYVQRIVRDDPFIVGDVVFLGIALGSVFNTVIALIQWLGLYDDTFGTVANIWIMEQPGKRPAGNIAQPNELATLLMWGMAAGLWGWARGKINWVGFFVYGILLAVGLALTQSRIGILQSGFMWLALIVLQKRFGGWRLPVVYSAILGLQVVLFLHSPEIGAWLKLSYAGRDMTGLGQDGARMAIYESAWTALMQAPWIGYGAAHFVTAQWIAGAQLPALNSYYMQSHSWILDFLLWFGLPLGGLLILTIITWFGILIVKIRETTDTVLMLALLTFAMHATVELPHWAVVYLITAVIFAAHLRRGVPTRWVWRSSRSLVVLLTALCITVVCRVTLEYIRLEENFVKFRAEQMRVRTDISDVPVTVALTHLADMLRMGRMRPSPHYSAEEIAWMERTISASPIYQNQFTHAATLALVGRKQEALIWMDRLNSSSSAGSRAEYERVWKNYQLLYQNRTSDISWPAARAAYNKVEKKAVTVPVKQP